MDVPVAVVKNHGKVHEVWPWMPVIHYREETASSFLVYRYTSPPRGTILHCAAGKSAAPLSSARRYVPPQCCHDITCRCPWNQKKVPGMMGFLTLAVNEKIEQVRDANESTYPRDGNPKRFGDVALLRLFDFFVIIEFCLAFRAELCAVIELEMTQWTYFQNSYARSQPLTAFGDCGLTRCAPPFANYILSESLSPHGYAENQSTPLPLPPGSFTRSSPE